MYEKVRSHILSQSVSSLYSNLDVLIEDNENSDDQTSSTGNDQKISFVTVSKKQVNIMHSYGHGRNEHIKVSGDSKVDKYNILQAKWCRLHSQDVLVIANYKGLLVYDAEGQLLLFWYSLENNSDDSDNEVSFCRGIACVDEKYVCIGTNAGKVLVLQAEKNSFTLKNTLSSHENPVSALAGLPKSASTRNGVNFVSGDDSGELCMYKSDEEFAISSRVTSGQEKLPVTSVQLLPNGLAVAGYLNGHLRVFDSLTSSLLADICAHVKAVSCLDTTLIPDKTSYYVISGSEDSFVRVWKISRDDVISVSQEWYKSMNDLQLCGMRFCDPSGRHIVLTGYDTTEVMQFTKV